MILIYILWLSYKFIFKETYIDMKRPEIPEIHYDNEIEQVNMSHLQCWRRKSWLLTNVKIEQSVLN